jgi:hypothetical protein
MVLMGGGEGKRRHDCARGFASRGLRGVCRWGHVRSLDRYRPPREEGIEGRGEAAGVCGVARAWPPD